MTIPARTKVLIVGAGPTGLMLANQLRRHGIDIVVIDRNAGPSVATKALGVQARTLEIYAQLGIVNRALELGHRATGANMWSGGQRVARIPLRDIGRELSAFPFLLILGQDDNERLLGDALRDKGTDVLWRTELASLEQSGDHVVTTLDQNGSSLQLRADWVAGCDGAHSAVRRLNGIDFPGAPYEHVFFVADTRVTGSMVKDELNIFLWPRGFHLFFPMRGTDHWRVVGILPAELRDRDDLGFDEVEPSICGQAGSSVKFQSCSWFSTYRIHHRRAAQFRDRRCFLLGDAAHIHSPVGAQGMNTGLQDAYNLGWKLAWVCNEIAGAGLLDSYETERIPVAERLLKTTDQAFSLVVSDGWLAKLIRTRLAPRALAFAVRFDRLRKLGFRTVSQIGIRYRGSPLSKALAPLPEGAPKPGDRFPWLTLKFSLEGEPGDLFKTLLDTQMNLILVGAHPLFEESRYDHDLVRVHQIPDDPFNRRALAHARIPTPYFYLLRPDGHIGFAGHQLDAGALSRYLEKTLFATSNAGAKR